MAKKVTIEKNEANQTYNIDFGGRGYGYAMVFEEYGAPAEVRTVSFDVRCERLTGAKAEGENVSLDVWMDEAQILELRDTLDATLKGIALRRKELQAVQS